MQEQNVIDQNIDPMVPVKFRVDQLIDETHDTFTLELSPEEGPKQFAFAPGQFNMLYKFGVGDVPISISGDPAQPDKLIHTIRSVGTVTESLRQVKQGDCIGLRGPFGSHWPVEKTEGKDVLIITGGIGLAPLRPAIYELMAQRDKLGKLVILYGTRSVEDLLFREQIEQWRSNLDMQVRVTVDTADLNWYGTVGVVTKLIDKVRFDPSNSIAMVCGPEVMMHFTVQELLKAGMKTDDIYISMERNMKCATGFCGHCQYGPHFICKDGPVFCYQDVQKIFRIKEV